MGLKSMFSAFLAPRGWLSDTQRGSSSEREEETYDLAVSGALDHRSAPGIRKLMFEEALRHREIRIDLSGLELIDRAGLATLVVVFAAAQRGGVALALHRPSDSVRRALRFTRLDRVFPIVDSAAGPKLAATMSPRRGGVLACGPSVLA
jgi:anti-anti-sigma factor